MSHLDLAGRARCWAEPERGKRTDSRGIARDAPLALYSGSLAELDHAADAVLRFHQLEAAVDLVQRELVGDHRLEVDLACEPAVDQLRNLVAALDSAEGRARDGAAGDQEARHDVERLALPGDAADRREAPAHAGGLDGLPHHGDVPGRLEGVVGSEAAGQIEDLLPRVRPAGGGVRRPLAARELEPPLREVDADDPLGALQATARNRAQTNHPGAED